ncbi:MAG: hypothetical protein M1820_006788 [Bogoriella megaspora]|nr:MAG: hypothetical protein M1820_006788 [Bogoriella megaspora]
MVHLRSSQGQTAGLHAEHVATEPALPNTTKRRRDAQPDQVNGHSNRPVKAPKLQLTRSQSPVRNTRQRDATTKSSHSRLSREGVHPPTKLSASQPHGDLFQTTNGVRTNLKITEDDINTQNSKASTPAEGDDQAQKKRSTRGQDKRTLRSQDGGSRLKSELATYFQNYDEIINDTPVEPGNECTLKPCLLANENLEFLDLNTKIYVIDETPKGSKAAQPESSSLPKKTSKSKTSRQSDKSNGTSVSSTNHSITSYFSRRPSAQYNGAQLVDFSSIDRNTTHEIEDPLSDAVYAKAHKRAERKEKQLRNIEKERAMHEKVQLERLLESLRGHDWLKVMGISGVTDTEAKRFEPKRDYFVTEVQALVDKFGIWRQEEKRMRLEKEQAQQARAEAEKEEEQDEMDAASSAGPASSDIDASAARQLQLEASSATRSWNPLKLEAPAKALLASPEKAFTSFFPKPHLREAALGKTRRGRTAHAFGHSVPEVEEREFTLPEDYLTPEAITAAARKRRRLKRGVNTG